MKKRLFETKGIKHHVVAYYSKKFTKSFVSLQIPSFSFHNLRHTFVSLVAQAGGDVTSISSLIGHSNLAMTAKYSHAQDAGKIKAIEALDNLISERKVL